MKLEKLFSKMPCQILCAGSDLKRTIRGGYACDMLSWVVSRIDSGEIWLTILNSVNVVAVATLSECACVMLTESVEMEADVLSRAKEKGLTIVTTPLTTYEAAVSISRLLEAEQTTAGRN